MLDVPLWDLEAEAQKLWMNTTVFGCCTPPQNAPVRPYKSTLHDTRYVLSLTSPPPSLFPSPAARHCLALYSSSLCPSPVCSPAHVLPTMYIEVCNTLVHAMGFL